MASKRWNLERLQSEASYWRSCILITAAHLDLFGWIGKRGKSPRALAGHFGGRPMAWEIFLNALCGMGLMRKRGKRYPNTAFSSRHLSRGEATVLLAAYDEWDIWGGLASVLISGKRPKVHKPFFSDHRKAKRLLHGLHLHAQEIAPYLIAKLPLGRCRTLLDVGGGLGTFSVAFCRHYPRLRATLVEHPSVLALARRAVREAGMAKKVRVIGSDFSRDALPRGFDAVFVSNVLHARGVNENRSLLHKLHRCLNPQGQLILRDVFMNRDGTAPEWGTLFSLLLLLQTPQGRCYALDEIRAWLRQAGFSRIERPFRSSPLFFDPDSVLIAKKS